MNKIKQRTGFQQKKSQVCSDSARATSGINNFQIFDCHFFYYSNIFFVISSQQHFFSFNTMI